eukprot:UN24577
MRLQGRLREYPLQTCNPLNFKYLSHMAGGVSRNHRNESMRKEMRKKNPHL